MNKAIEQYFIIKQAEGIAQYAHWEEALFAQLKDGCISYLSEQVKKQRNSQAVEEAYINLLAEGMAQKVILQSQHVEHYQWYKDHITWHSVLEYLLLQKIPHDIAQIKPQQQLSWMRDIWNIGENLLTQSPWVALYLRHNTQQLDESTHVLEQIQRLLQPLFVAQHHTQWQPPFQVQQLDTRQLSNDFLPGYMHAVAPSVYCLHDRRHASRFGGIYLTDSVTFVPNHCCLSPEHTQLKTTPHAISNETVTLSDNHQITLPGLYEPHSQCVSEQGHALFSAIDSQRLWLIQAAS